MDVFVGVGRLGDGVGAVVDVFVGVGRLGDGVGAVVDVFQDVRHLVGKLLWMCSKV